MYGENFVISILISLFFISETNTSRNKATEKNYLDNKRMNHNNANGLVRAI